MYIVMGWIIVIAIKPLLQSVALEGVILLFAGGISYTLGAVIYRLKKIPLNHAIFHICVLIGSLCHFISVYFYVV
jgi:hemolysin III